MATSNSSTPSNYPSTAGKSFTSQPLLELHLHSSLSVLTKTLALLSLLSSQPDFTSLNLPLRPAERGEFTRQAFMSGRMDLTEVEGLRDLIEAETEDQRKLARSMVGVRTFFSLSCLLALSSSILYRLHTSRSPIKNPTGLMNPWDHFFKIK